MNVYDFDKTIYNGDSTIDFYLFCMKKNPRILFCLLRQIKAVFLHKMGKIDTTCLKEEFFCFLDLLNDVDTLIENFWNQNQSKIKKWYLRQKKETDLVISASPAFLIEPICTRLEIAKPIATIMDPGTGKITGKNCKGKEKVRRFLNRVQNQKIEAFYSDSQSDLPLAQISQQAYLVNKDKIRPWRRD